MNVYRDFEKDSQLFVEKRRMTKAAFFQAYKRMSASESHHFLLESGKDGHFSMFGLRPFAVLKGKNDRLTIETGGKKVVQNGDLLTLVKDWLQPFSRPSIPHLPVFQGGAVGYLSYDLVRQFESLSCYAEDDLQCDDLYFLVFHDLFVYDDKTQTLFIMIRERQEQAAKERIRQYESRSFVEPRTLDEVKDNRFYSMNEKEFVDAVEKVKNYIRQGDVFQVNLSVRKSDPLKTTPLNIYEKVREINPSPYMAYFHVPELQLVSASPELLVKKRGRKVSTRPIAGTRSRGKTKREEMRLEKRLLANDKERAEHVMLVDLERNDLGKVCRYGSVNVDELMRIEKYSHVMHIVSTVSGELAEGYDGFDLIRACFPGGTITGAPKIRTMEIIEELEPVRRGIYTGSIGWIGFNGDLEFNIAIRTLIAKDGYAHVQAGAGIVIDSNPSAEYNESLKKAKALWHAKMLSEDETRLAKV